MRIIAYRTLTNNGKVQLLESTREATKPTDDFSDLLGALLEPYERAIRICWELDATVAPILKLLGEERCGRLHRTHKCKLSPNEGIFYVPGKVFSVDGIIRVDNLNYKAKSNLYDLQQYYPELDEPEELAEVQALGEKLMYELKKMGLVPSKLTSPVAVYEECMMRRLDLPSVADMPKEAAEFAYRASGKLWIEAHTLGFYEQAWDYDIVSAFPSVAKDLIDIRQCEWVKSSEYQLNAIYSYVKCEVTIYDWVMVSPILTHDEEGNLISFTGTVEEFLTKSEIDFVNKWRIGKVNILEGWWAIPKT